MPGNRNRFAQPGGICKTRWSGRVSRILLPAEAGGDHSSGRSVARPLVRPTRSSNETGRLSLHIWACWRWGLPCRPRHRERGALLPHHFTLTGHSHDGGSRPAVCFLWHFPSDRSGSPLATTVPYPVRTFLPACGKPQAERSPRPLHQATVYPARRPRGHSPALVRLVLARRIDRVHQLELAGRQRPFQVGQVICLQGPMHHVHKLVPGRRPPEPRPSRTSDTRRVPRP